MLFPGGGRAHASTVRLAAGNLLRKPPAWLMWLHRKALLAILRRRTPALGGHVELPEAAVTQELAPLAPQNKAVIHGLLFRSSAEMLMKIAGDPQHLGAEIGFFCVLHTWNQKLQQHPHVHCVAAAGGLSSDRTHQGQVRSDAVCRPACLRALAVGLPQARSFTRSTFRARCSLALTAAVVTPRRPTISAVLSSSISFRTKTARQVGGKPPTALRRA